MSTGEVHIDSAMLVWGHHAGERRAQPVSSYLILGGSEPVIVDTGFRSVTGGPFSQVQEQALEVNLARFGIEPEDVGLVIHTHLHADHAGRSDLFPNAKLVIRAQELEYARAPLFPARLYHQDEIDILTGDLRPQLEIIKEDQELVTGIKAVHTGGHTPGHQVVYVQLESGTAIIAGDLVYLIDPGLTEQMPPGIYTDLRDVMAALAMIQRDADHVLPMHDESVYERYPDGVR